MTLRSLAEHHSSDAADVIGMNVMLPNGSWTHHHYRNLPFANTARAHPQSNAARWGNAAGLDMDSSSVSLDSSSIGLDSSSVGMDSSSVGLDSSSVGPDSSAVGLDSRSVGLDNRSVGPDSSSMAQTAVL